VSFGRTRADGLATGTRTPARSCHSMRVRTQQHLGQGIWYLWSMTNGECAALYERAFGALPAAPAFNERLDSPKLLASLSQLADALNYDLV
jgi:hypothetical protein